MLVYIEHHNGKIKKSSLELLSYAKAFQGQKVIAVAVNCPDISQLQDFATDEIISIEQEALQDFNALAYATLLSSLLEEKKENYLLLSASSDAQYLAPLLAIQIQGTYLPNISSLPEGGMVRRAIFSNRLTEQVSLPEGKAVLGLATNSFGLHPKESALQVSTFTPSLPDDIFGVKQQSLRSHTQKVRLSEAAVVVSGGRGMQGPEHWHLIETLAQTLGAATACSKPVSDMGWRPHSEHVGQTGQTIACNLYIAVGISGAIQHLAGVKASKVKVVINSDPNAPFFKEADYGIVGNLFEILPQLTQKLQEKLA